MDHVDKITESEKLGIEAIITEQEIKEAIFASSAQGAPCPNGFSFLFYQTYWDIIKSDIILLCSHFYCHDLDLTKLNKSVICLIPKEKDALVINKYRPISFVNSSFKIISKILTNMLVNLF